MPPKNSQTAAIIPRPKMDDLTGWNELERSEQQHVRREAELLAQAIYEQGRSGLEIGRHLSELRDALVRKHKRVWLRLLEAMNIRVTTAYRYIRSYKNASKAFPQNILDSLIAKGVTFSRPTPTRPLGKLTEIVEVLPPPRTTDARKVEHYTLEVVRRLGEKPKKRKPRVIEGERFSEDLLKDVYRYAILRFQRVPLARRLDWLSRLAGYLLGDGEVTETLRAKPLPLPDGYKAQPGRPRNPPKTD